MSATFVVLMYHEHATSKTFENNVYLWTNTHVCNSNKEKQGINLKKGVWEGEPGRVATRGWMEEREG